LIKTALLSSASKQSDEIAEYAYDSWKRWLDCLGDDYATQERFFRQFYNAFKFDWELSITGVPVATKSKLIKVYDQLSDRDLTDFVEKMDAASKAYGRIAGNIDADVAPNALDDCLRDLTFAQGAPSFMLMLFLLVNQERFDLSEDSLVQIADLLITFSIRRNLTNTPPTYDLDRLFIGIIEKLPSSTGDIYELIRDSLKAVSADEATFDAHLRGPIYDENSGSARFILVKLAERSMTKETRRNLWERQKSGEKDVYLWTIEHILPQGENLPRSWVEALGGPEKSRQTQISHVHTLGNLTITAYNSSLGNKTFTDKRDRVDSEGRFVGYRNGLSLNSDLVDLDSWSEERIALRTEKLVSEVKALFSF
jgi:Protein of unknown function (DUF1524)